LRPPTRRRQARTQMATHQHSEPMVQERRNDLWAHEKSLLRGLYRSFSSQIYQKGPEPAIYYRRGRSGGAGDQPRGGVGPGPGAMGRATTRGEWTAVLNPVLQVVKILGAFEAQEGPCRLPQSSADFPAGVRPTASPGQTGQSGATVEVTPENCQGRGRRQELLPVIRPMSRGRQTRHTLNSGWFPRTRNCAPRGFGRQDLAPGSHNQGHGPPQSPAHKAIIAPWLRVSRAFW